MHAATWMILKIIMPSEKAQKKLYNVGSHLCKIKENTN